MHNKNSNDRDPFDSLEEAKRVFMGALVAVIFSAPFWIILGFAIWRFIHRHA